MQNNQYQLVDIPAVSVVMPLYNCSEFLPQCLDSLLDQTYSNFELIMVDDGSSDDTIAIARQYLRRFESARLLCQEHRFAGSARNWGIEEAKGSYVICLDGDDYFMPTLIESLYRQACETGADICVCKAVFLDNATGKISNANHTCNLRLCPDASTFNRHTNARNIFAFTTPAPWTKLYRRDFILGNHLFYQDTRSANDLKFTMLALALAERIAVVDEELVVYRRNNKHSLQATQNKDPFAFYRALLALREELSSRALLPEMNEEFVNLSFGNCMYNFEMLGNGDAQESLYQFLKSEGFEKLGITKNSESVLHDQAQRYIDNYHNIMSSKNYSNYLKMNKPKKNTAIVYGRAVAKCKRAIFELLNKNS